MGLDFGYTCPTIDAGINDMKEIIESHIDDHISELSPLISAVTRLELTKDWGEKLYDELESTVEGIRETNEDIRKEADRQIDNLESEIDDLKSENKLLQDEISSL